MYFLLLNDIKNKKHLVSCIIVYVLDSFRRRKSFGFIDGERVDKNRRRKKLNRKLFF